MAINSLPEKDHSHENNDQRYQEHKQRYAVNAMHITHPFTMGRFGIALLNIEIFSQLSPHSHFIFV
jgi:hypothetical protein